MRDCPSCKCERYTLVLDGYNSESVIKSWGKSPRLSLYRCDNCEMLYVDATLEVRNDVDQAWFDHYYTHFYKTDDAPFSAARLESLARCVREMNIWRVLDIGGMDGELAKRLEKLGIACTYSGVGHMDAKMYPAVILSHTLEHIYDVPAMFQRIKAALVPGGLLFVEVPIWLNYDDLAYDNHWQHVNKFRPSDLESIFKENGFDVILSKQIEDYREYHCWRIIGRFVSSPFSRAGVTFTDKQKNQIKKLSQGEK